MHEILRYRGRSVTERDVAEVRELIAAHPEASRRALSALLCLKWHWVQPNGVLCAMVCRGLMLALHRQGQITLPEVRRKNPNPLAVHKRPEPVRLEERPVCCSLKALGSLEIAQVRRTGAERMVAGLIEAYHYLGYVQPVGEHLKFLVTAKGQPIACLCYSSAPRHLGPRDRYIGWSIDQRKANIRYIAYQSRFLILPWVKVPHLASHLLGFTSRMLPAAWEQVYGHPVYFAETFVDPERYKGTCYRAANWVYLGQTTGRGKDAPTKKANRSLKDVLGYPLTKRFREHLCGG